MRTTYKRGLRSVLALALVFTMLAGALPAFALTDEELAEIQTQMDENSAAWHTAKAEGNTELMEQLEAENEAYRNQLSDGGANVDYDPATGVTTVNGNDNSNRINSDPLSKENMEAYLANGGTKDGLVDAYNNVAQQKSESNYYNSGNATESAEYEADTMQVLYGWSDEERDEYYDALKEIKEDYAKAQEGGASDQKLAAIHAKAERLRAHTAGYSGDEYGYDNGGFINYIERNNAPSHDGTTGDVIPDPAPIPAPNIPEEISGIVVSEKFKVTVFVGKGGAVDVVTDDNRSVSISNSTANGASGTASGDYYAGAIYVVEDGDIDAYIMADFGYRVASIIVNGNEAGAGFLFSMDNIQKDYTIVILFESITHGVTVNAHDVTVILGEGGTATVATNVVGITSTTTQDGVNLTVGGSSNDNRYAEVLDRYITQGKPEADAGLTSSTTTERYEAVLAKQNTLTAADVSNSAALTAEEDAVTLPTVNASSSAYEAVLAAQQTTNTPVASTADDNASQYIELQLTANQEAWITAKEAGDTKTMEEISEANSKLQAQLAVLNATPATKANESETIIGAISKTYTVASGKSVIIEIAAKTGYTVYSVWVNGTELGTVGSYGSSYKLTLSGINEDYTVSVAFKNTYTGEVTDIDPSLTITASADAGGTISPSGTIAVGYGDSKTFTITPNTGFAIQSVIVDGVNAGAISSYTFDNITSSHTIHATFALLSGSDCTITASAGTGGTISPSGTIAVGYGDSKTFTITPNTGFAIQSVIVDGVNAGAISSYTFDNITSSHTIHATFALLSGSDCTITASAGAGGTISPSGTIAVGYGDSKTFTITPDAGYEVNTVTVNGASAALTNGKYTFTNITGNQTISVTFKLKSFTITASAGAGGSISPSGTITVGYGDSKTFTITPNTGFAIQSVIVDGVNAGAISSYTFNTITAAHTISATFKSLSSLDLGDADLVDGDGDSLDGTMKSGYGFFAELDLNTQHVTDLKVTCEYNFGQGKKTVELECVDGEWVFPKNAESALKRRCVYVPVETADGAYTITFKVTGKGTDGTTLSATITKTLIIDGSMYEDDFSATRS